MPPETDPNTQDRVRSMPFSVNHGQEPVVDRTSDAARSGVGSERRRSKYHGVVWWKRPYGHKWCARIWIDGKRKVIGLYDDEEEAARAYDEAADNRDGALAKRNFLRGGSGAEPGADVIERESESVAGSQNASGEMPLEAKVKLTPRINGRILMNKLIKFCHTNGLCETRVMNILQEHGIVSDNCITLDQVGNRMHALTWLVNRGIKDLRRTA